MNRRILVITVLVALVVLANNWLSNRQQRKRQAAVTAARVPDYFLRDFTATTMDTQGKPAQRLTAQLMDHYSDDNSMLLTAPQLTLYQRHGTPWQLDAARGRITGNGREVLLSDGVHMAHGNGPDRLTLTTDHLRVRPRRHYAETDAPVTVATPQGKVQAVGLRADLASGQLQLLAKVRGDYAPKLH